MTTLATTFSRHISRQGAAYRTFSGPSYMKRFSYFIEHSDWDEKILVYEKWVNKIYVDIMIASVLYFMPITIKVFLR